MRNMPVVTNKTIFLDDKTSTYCVSKFKLKNNLDKINLLYWCSNLENDQKTEILSIIKHRNRQKNI